MQTHASSCRINRPLPILCLFGEPGLLSGERSIKLKLNYQKGGALLGYLSSHPGKALRREHLANLFWPNLDTAAGRANLRVVLADVHAALKTHDVQQALVAQREWIQFAPDNVLLTDRCVVQRYGSPASAIEPEYESAVTQWAKERAERVWLESIGETMSADFTHWLTFQRQALADCPAERRDAGRSAPAAVESVPSSGAAHASPELLPVAVLRIDLGSLDTSPDVVADDAALARVGKCIPLLDAEAAALGGMRVKQDDAGCLYVFGLGSQHAAYRNDTLQFVVQGVRLLAADISIRMGLTFGFVMRTGIDAQAVSGWRLRLAERLSLTAEAGHLVCDQSVRDLARAYAFQPLGERSFRGLAITTQLFAWDLQQASGFNPWAMGDTQAPFVGREADLGILRERLGDREPLTTMANGHPQQVEHQRHGCSTLKPATVCLRGPSGIGKTRLAAEYARWHQQQGGRVVWFAGRPEAVTEPWSALRDVWSREFGGTQACSPDADAWRRTWRTQPPSADMVSVVSRLVSARQVDARQRPVLADAVAWLLGRGMPCSDRPVLVVVDEAPWIDAPTRILLTQVAGQLDRARWLVTCQEAPTPTLVEVQTHAFLQALPGLVEYRLPPLSETECDRLLRSHWFGDKCAEEREYLEGSHAAAPDEAVIRRRTQDSRGLPLYLLAQCDAPFGNGPFDAYCHALINRMGDVRPVFDKAALLGMLFRVTDLEELCGQQPTGIALAKGVAAQFLLRRGSEHCAFFHQALLDYLIRTLPREALMNHATQIAQHYERKSLYAKAAALWERAQDPGHARHAWREAAQAALQANDTEAACEHFAQIERLGYATTEEPVDLAVTLRLQHAEALVAHKGYGFARVHQLAHEVSAITQDFQATPTLRFRIAALAYLGSSSQGRIDGLGHAAALADMAAEPSQHVAAAWAQGNTRLWLGLFDSSREWLQRCVELSAAVGNVERSQYFASDPAVFAATQLAWLMWLQGESSDDIERVKRQAAEWFLGSTHRQDVCVYHSMNAFLAWSQGDAAALGSHATESLHVAEAEGFALWRALAGLQLAAAQALQGQSPDLAALAAQASEVTESYRAGLTTALWLTAGVLLACGQYEQALAVTDDILAHVEQREHRYCLMDIWRLRAQALAAQGQAEAAQQAMQTALTLARDNGLHGWASRWAAA